VLSETPQFTRELFAYTSDGLRITGQLTRPRGQGPFPVIVLNHGYFPLNIYRTGNDTQHASDYLAARGYLCLAPDFRSHAGSDPAPNTFRAGHVIDTLNLLPLISQLPDARPGPIGMWGHSNGGEITSKAMLISNQIAAALIYAPASPTLADNYYAFHADDPPSGPRATAAFPLTPDQAPDLFARLSPINYLHYAQAPVQIHYGTADDSVPIEWVDQLHQGLLAAGKQSELLLYNGGAHSLQGADKQRYLERMLAFFEQYVGR
jgi:dipeptidyl aminopeptidase/acylaminoacyl peptidase